MIVTRTSKATQSREIFIMVHLAVMSSLLVCLRTQIFSFAPVAAAWNWNIFICVFVCVHTYIFETGCKDKMLFRSKGKEKLQARKA